MIILLGSRAARAWFPKFREPHDWDALASISTIRAWYDRNDQHIRSLVPTNGHKLKCRMVDGTSIEFEILGESGSGASLMAMSQEFKPCDFPYGEALAATPTLLWLTKHSHIYWPIHWQKNIRDLHWLKSRSREPTGQEVAYHKMRFGEHTLRYKSQSVKLTQTNESFFAKSNKIGRKIEHDRIHEIVAYGSRPLFENFKTDPTKAMLSRTLFEQASLTDRLRLVREEAMAIAVERYAIPAMPNRVEPQVAYGKALCRICTTLTSGWFRDFAIDHWPEVCDPDKEFIDDVLKEVH